jgi:hypothetical protein
MVVFKSMTKVEANEPVILILHSPREKVWGVLQEINGAGVFLRCIDLNAFEDYIGSIARGEPFIGLCSQFFPLWRVERLTRDESSGEIQSLSAQFERRTGQNVLDF